MSDIRESWRILIAQKISELLSAQMGEDKKIEPSSITLEVPPNPEMGDLGFPMFAFARDFKKAPPVIAQEVVRALSSGASSTGAGSTGAGSTNDLGTAKAIGPYVNVFLPKGNMAAQILQKVSESGEQYGREKSQAGRRVMVEFSSPNTNKPLHLGHLRNDALGESVSRILKFAGAEVYKVNIINNRGVHICKSMLAYQKFFTGKTPETQGVKSDRFVGDCYVAYNNYAKEQEAQSETEVQAMLQAWEAGDEATLKLWKQMNFWAESGIQQTYERTGVSFDKIYYESDTYLKGREEILEGLEKGLFYKEADGSVWVNLEPIGLDKKVLLRKDGTALYITQDIGTAIYRHTDWDFNELVYVVGSEQIYHFKVLFYVLKQLGYDWAQDLYHLSYGMVNLPEGKMKSREGTVVDGDDLINELRDGALEEIKAKEREEAVGNATEVAEKIALGALHYFLLQVSPTKDMIFNPKDSLSFQGNTGPYLQYMGARISSILRKAEKESAFTKGKIHYDLLAHESEWALLKTIKSFPSHVERAAHNFDPSIITAFLYELSKNFSAFYRDCPILSVTDSNLMRTRLELVQATKISLENAMHLVLVPFLERM